MEAGEGLGLVGLGSGPVVEARQEVVDSLLRLEEAVHLALASPMTETDSRLEAVRAGFGLVMDSWHRWIQVRDGLPAWEDGE